MITSLIWYVELLTCGAEGRVRHPPCIVGRISNLPVNAVLGLRHIFYRLRAETGVNGQNIKRRGHNMSRQLKRENKKITETPKNENECIWLYNEVCCNDSSEWLADFPHEFCKSCRYFTKERK